MTGVRFVIIPLLLFLFFLTPFIKADDHCQEGKCQTYALDIYGDAIEDSDLVGHVIHVCTTINPILCFTWCVDDCRCLSFNYKEKNEGNICELNEGSHFTNQSSLKNSPRSRYYNLRREISRQVFICNDTTDSVQWLIWFVLVRETRL